MQFYANKLLASLEKDHGQIDFKDAWKKWEPMFKDIIKEELEARRLRENPKEKRPI